jgi:hypothetical protein
MACLRPTLPTDFFVDHFLIDARGRTTTTKQKVDIAKKYVKLFDSFDACSSSLDLERNVAKLFTTIQTWNHQSGE